MHESAAREHRKDSNERLEFLGDAVVGLAAAASLARALIRPAALRVGVSLPLSGPKKESGAQIRRALRLAGDRSQGEKRVREMESGKRQISGPVSVAVESFLHGYKPVGFEPDSPEDS